MTMRDQCIEAMARTLAKRRYGINLPDPLGAYSPGSRISECVCDATAAFDTLLEKLKIPTEEMLEALKVASGVSTADAITRIADIAEAVGWQAGVGASETAGQIVSYLAAHPEYVEALLRDGFFALPDNFWEHGRLTWMGMNGQIVKPEFVRQRRTINAMLSTLSQEGK